MRIIRVRGRNGLLDRSATQGSRSLVVVVAVAVVVSVVGVRSPLAPRKLMRLRPPPIGPPMKTRGGSAPLGPPV